MSKRNAHGLGRAMLNDKARQRATRDHSNLHTTDLDEAPKWVKLQSVTQERDLDEFLSTAILSGTDFTAERQNVKLISNDSNYNPYLPTLEERQATIQRQNRERHRLVIPRRPQWYSNTTPAELDRLEKESFLEWRRGLADLQETGDLMMTPFERNLEVWRQLWRVVERSDVIVQIVDARNPLLYRCVDLERYVIETSSTKKNMLLINKADLLTSEQRRLWGEYFNQQGIAFTFFSAVMAEDDEGDIEGGKLSNDNDNDKELQSLFLDLLGTPIGDASRPKTIGLVGYPNVGKSSTVNALIKATKVSVSSTPGKTKHFQTIHLTKDLVLCDCPGLVFPNFAATKAELICNGILPIDQMKDHMGPASLLVERIPIAILELAYGITINVRAISEGGNGMPTAEDLLTAYARARGFTKSGQGNPDEARAARIILKDYINGRLLFCHSPPGSIHESEFNRDANDQYLIELRERKCISNERMSAHMRKIEMPSTSANEMDREFFNKEYGNLPKARGRKQEFARGYTHSRVTMFPHQRGLKDDGTPTDGEQTAYIVKSKKHFKGKMRYT